MTHTASRVLLRRLLLLFLVASAIGAASVSAAGTASNLTDLGGLDLDAYCQHIGLSHSMLQHGESGKNAAYNNWVCAAANNTTQALDLQAACEFSFPQRPIVADATNPNDAFSWNCFQVNGTFARGGTHGSGTQVICNFVFATGQDTCTATVGEGSLASPTTPTGTVTFTNSTQGSFPSGNVCALAPSPHSGSVASCSVQFKPVNFPTVFPGITATYGGDSTHARSIGQTAFGVVTSISGATLNGTSVTLSSVCAVGVSSCSDVVDVFSGSGTLPGTAAAAKATLLGRASFKATGGTEATTHLHLNRTGRALTKAHPKLHVRMLVTSRAGTAAPGTQSFPFTLSRKH